MHSISLQHTKPFHNRSRSQRHLEVTRVYPLSATKFLNFTPSSLHGISHFARSRLAASHTTHIRSCYIFHGVRAALKVVNGNSGTTWKTMEKHTACQHPSARDARENSRCQSISLSRSSQTKPNQTKQQQKSITFRRARQNCLLIEVQLVLAETCLVQSNANRPTVWYCILR